MASGTRELAPSRCQLGRRLFPQETHLRGILSERYPGNLLHIHKSATTDLGLFLQRETLSLRSCVFSGRGTLESELEHMRPIKRGSGENCPQCPRITRPPLSLGKSHSLCAFEKGIPLVFCTPHRVREQVTTITPTVLGVFWRRRQGGF